MGAKEPVKALRATRPRGASRGVMRRSTVKQHYVPRFLLRHWAGRTKLGDGTLQVVPIDTRQAGLLFAEETSMNWFAQDSGIFGEATERTFSMLEQKAGMAIQQVTQLIAGQDQASINTNRITSGLRGFGRECTPQKHTTTGGRYRCTRAGTPREEPRERDKADRNGRDRRQIPDKGVPEI